MKACACGATLVGRPLWCPTYCLGDAPPTPTGRADATQEQRTCEGCGRRFCVRAHRPHRFCSRACSAARAPWNYAGGITITGGRAYVSCRDGSRVPFTHAVVAAYHGREVEPGEIVHHANGDHGDDRPENLAVLSRADHMAVHRAELTERLRSWHAETKAA